MRNQKQNTGNLDLSTKTNKIFRNTLIGLVLLFVFLWLPGIRDSLTSQELGIYLLPLIPSVAIIWVIVHYAQIRNFNKKTATFPKKKISLWVYPIIVIIVIIVAFIVWGMILVGSSFQ
jgi:hypothetical protein